MKEVRIMKTYSYTDEPIRLYGVPFFDKELVRMPQTLIDELGAKTYQHLARRCPGARLRFRTNSKSFGIKIKFGTLSIDYGMSAFGCQSASVYIGAYPDQKYLGLAKLKSYDIAECEDTFTTDGTMQDITVFLPRNEHIDDILLTFEDDASVEAPTPYRYEKPIVFYGSSITEGGCCNNVANAYTTLVSRALDVDFINLGLSGSARGQLAMADYINKIDMSVFVYDYDHNSPDPEHLRSTHEPFFRRIREAHPELPILMLSRPFPKIEDNADTSERREIVRTTFENAKQHGDSNVYFIDGNDFFDDDVRESCFLDGIHPNDLGFWLMAEKVIPVIRGIFN